jgi:hypothetical protein
MEAGASVPGDEPVKPACAAGGGLVPGEEGEAAGLEKGLKVGVLQPFVRFPVVDTGDAALLTGRPLRLSARCLIVA